ncbi:MAG: hypothetical protein Tsb002_38030 [Wenzhouxiangellaceae bacterium]
MNNTIDYATASSHQIETHLCDQLRQLRLLRNLTQGDLAATTGVSKRTLSRLENGEGVSLDTYIRVMMGLGIQQRLQALFPESGIQPVLEARQHQPRQRARPDRVRDQADQPWHWNDPLDQDHEAG